MFGENGLVAFFVAGLIGAVDVGREGNVADALQLFMNGSCAGELDFTLALIEMSGDGGGEMWGEFYLFADEEFFAGTDEGSPAVALGIESAEKKDLNFAGAAGTGAKEAGRDDAGIVEDHAIARLQVGREIAELVVMKGLSGSVEDEHAGIGASGEGLTGDELVGEIVLKVFYSEGHG